VPPVEEEVKLMALPAFTGELLPAVTAVGGVQATLHPAVELMV